MGVSVDWDNLFPGPTLASQLPTVVLVSLVSLIQCDINCLPSDIGIRITYSWLMDYVKWSFFMPHFSG